MKLSIDDVRHIANLARLGLSDDELGALSGELSKILDYIDQLNEVDTSSIPPTARVDDLVDVWREDEVRPSFPRAAALQGAPDTDGTYFRVRAIQGVEE